MGWCGSRSGRGLGWGQGVRWWGSRGQWGSMGGVVGSKVVVV